MYTYTEEGAFISFLPPEIMTADEAMSDLIALCIEWHGGQWSAFYSLASTHKIHDDDHKDTLVAEVKALAREDRDVSDYMMGLLNRLGIHDKMDLMEEPPLHQ